MHLGKLRVVIQKAPWDYKMKSRIQQQALPLVQLTWVDSCPILDPRSPKVEFPQPACWEVRVTPSSETLPLRYQLKHSLRTFGGAAKALGSSHTGHIPTAIPVKALIIQCF